MLTENQIKKQKNNSISIDINPVQRITALWALSEAALGGVLHALRIPFTGLFIGSSAVIFITLISFFNGKRGTILKATLVVMIIKAIVSPYSPVNAYLAVAFQGLIGELLFSLVKSKKIAAFFLGFLSLLESSVQKILVITIVFGQNIWDAIDLFSKYVLTQFLLGGDSTNFISISKLLITVYMSIHIITGIIIGIWAPRLAAGIVGTIRNTAPIESITFKPSNQSEKKNKRKHKIWKKASVLTIFMLATAIFILSYFFPVFEKSKGLAALIMLFRSIMIMGLWLYLIGPYILKYLRQFLNKKSTVYRNEVNEILNIFPVMKQVIRQAWLESKDKPRIKRIPSFVESLLIYLLTMHVQRPPERK